MQEKREKQKKRRKVKKNATRNRVKLKIQTPKSQHNSI